MSNKAETRNKVSAVPGWFTMPPAAPQLIGSKCKSCGDYFFPKAQICRNPVCDKKLPLEDALLSKRGKLFAYTITHRAPPLPYHAPNPFVPFGVVVVQLKEGLKVVGQVQLGVNLDRLKIGIEMEVVVDRLYTDDKGNNVLAWFFKPV